MNKKITFTLTSCGRPDLLERTLDSFFEYNTYQIEKFIISEDAAIVGINDVLIKKYSDKNIEWILNSERKGQIKTIDYMYSKIETAYIFHCEEDWLFTDYSFIEKSLNILEHNPKILQVWLRGHSDTNGHPIEYFNDEFDLPSLGYLGVYNGFSFNPGLRRLSDYQLINNYGSLGHERQVSIKYGELGFRSAILKTKHIEHIGWGRHIIDIH